MKYFYSEKESNSRPLATWLIRYLILPNPRWKKTKKKKRTMFPSKEYGYFCRKMSFDDCQFMHTKYPGVCKPSPSDVKGCFEVRHPTLENSQPAKILSALWKKYGILPITPRDYRTFASHLKALNKQVPTKSKFLDKNENFVPQWIDIIYKLATEAKTKPTAVLEESFIDPSLLTRSPSPLSKEPFIHPGLLARSPSPHPSLLTRSPSPFVDPSLLRSLSGKRKSSSEPFVDLSLL